MTKRKAPAHLDKIAQAKWTELVTSLPDQTQGSLDALAAYCSAWSRWVTAEQEIAKTGPVVRVSGGAAAVSPFVIVSQQAQRQLRQWGESLKLTPKTKAARKASEEPEQDPVLRLIGKAE